MQGSLWHGNGHGLRPVLLASLVFMHGDPLLHSSQVAPRLTFHPPFCSFKPALPSNHAHTHARTLAHIQRHPHMRTRERTRVLQDMLVYVQTGRRTHACMHARTNVGKRMHVLQDMQVLRVKGLGVEALTGLAALTKLRDLTLTLSNNMEASAWHDLAGLTHMTRCASTPPLVAGTGAAQGCEPRPGCEVDGIQADGRCACHQMRACGYSCCSCCSRAATSTFLCVSQRSARCGCA